MFATVTAFCHGAIPGMFIGTVCAAFGKGCDADSARKTNGLIAGAIIGGVGGVVAYAGRALAEIPVCILSNDTSPDCTPSKMAESVLYAVTIIFTTTASILYLHSRAQKPHPTQQRREVV